MNFISSINDECNNNRFIEINLEYENIQHLLYSVLNTYFIVTMN